MTYLDMTISGSDIGYDPGGDSGHGLARLLLEIVRVREASADIQ